MRVLKFPQSIWHIGFLAGMLFLVSCSEDEGDNNGNDNFDRQAVLIQLADELIIPSYDSLATATVSLNSSCVELKENVTIENLERVQENWKNTLRWWQWVAAYDFGPSQNAGLISSFNLYPVDPALIESNIESGEYNLGTAGNLKATGLQAMDYLLFGVAEEKEDVLLILEENANAIQYLIDVSEVLKTKSAHVSNTWSTDYRSTFVNAIGTDLGSSLGLMLNGAIKYFEVHLRDAKIGIPAGARSSSGLPLPEQAEARYNGEVSTQMLVEGIRAWSYMFNGNSLNGQEGEGLDDYLNFLGPVMDGVPLADAINQRFEASIDGTHVIGNDIATAVEQNQIACLDIFDQMQQAVVLLKVDMTSAMGVQITYVDNDGD